MQEKAPARGPLVWRDMDQKALDDAYDQLIYAPNRDLVLARIAAASARARAALGAPQRVAYGPSEHEMLDIYRAPSPPGAGAPINIFIHGGAWRVGSAATNALVAEPSSAPAPTLSFSTSSISIRPAAICSRCTGKSAARSRGCGATPRVSAATATGFTYRPLLRLASFLLRAVAGLARRRPAGRFLQRRAAHQRHVRPRAGAAVEALRLRQIHRRDGASAERDAPYRRPDHAAPVCSWHLRDAGVSAPDARFFAAVKAAGKPAELIVGDNYNHFEIFETFANPYGLLGRALLRQMKLA